jgi:hypothetical protein
VVRTTKKVGNRCYTSYCTRCAHTITGQNTLNDSSAHNYQSFDNIVVKMNYIKRTDARKIIETGHPRTKYHCEPLEWNFLRIRIKKKKKNFRAETPTRNLVKITSAIKCTCRLKRLRYKFMKLFQLKKCDVLRCTSVNGFNFFLESTSFLSTEKRSRLRTNIFKSIE